MISKNVNEWKGSRSQDYTTSRLERDVDGERRKQTQQNIKELTGHPYEN